MRRSYNRAIQQQWYNSMRWRKLRKQLLAEHPMCQCPNCNEMGLEANVADHIEPHRGDARLFWNKDNLQALNKQCHDSWKQQQEGGRAATQQPKYGNDGVPLDAKHHWNEEPA